MQITSQTDIAILLSSSPSSSAHVCGHVHDQRRQYYNLDEARSIVVNNSVSSVEKIKE
jgi:hypothetical protein